MRFWGLKNNRKVSEDQWIVRNSCLYRSWNCFKQRLWSILSWSLVYWSSTLHNASRHCSFQSRVNGWVALIDKQSKLQILWKSLNIRFSKRPNWWSSLSRSQKEVHSTSNFEPRLVQRKRWIRWVRPRR